MSQAISRTVLLTYGAPAMIAVALHGTVAAGVWVAGRLDARPPRVLNSFEVVELPASAAREKTPEPQAEVQDQPQPVPQQEALSEPDPAPEPGPILTQRVALKSQPAPPPPPKPQPPAKPKPLAEMPPKPVVPKVELQRVLVQADASQAPAPTYVAPSQHAAYLDNPKPAYPTMARKRGMEGHAVLRVVVHRDGTVKSADVHQSTGYAILDRAARAAVVLWRFAPATQGGVPVEGEVLVPFDFRLTTG